MQHLHTQPAAEVLAQFAPVGGETVDVELGNFAAIKNDTSLWVSAAPIGDTGSRMSVQGAALAWIAARGTTSDERMLVDRLVVLDAVKPGVTARVLAATTLSTLVFDATTSETTIATPAPHLPAVPASPDHLAFGDLFRDAGADVVIEHGVVAAEVAGLEVARVVDENGKASARVGVGAHDRDAFRMLHGDLVTVDMLREVVRTVAAHRTLGAPKHPLNLLATERLLRHHVISQPERIGLRALQTAEPPVPRTNVKDDVPCCAVGVDLDDRDCVVVFTVGVDLDAIPFAVDARARLSPSARLLVVTEARNIIALQSKIASLFSAPVELVSA